MGVIIGDAMGMPVEMMSRQEILDATNGAGITGFVSSIQRKISDTANAPAGMPTDDWQLTKIIGESIIARGEFDITDIALRHIAALEGNNFGYGSTTREGIESMRDYFDSRGMKGRSPHDAPKIIPGRGSGNGIAMKVSPIALKNVIDPYGSDISPNVAELGQMTHSDTRAWAAAYAIAIFIMELDEYYIDTEQYFYCEKLNFRDNKHILDIVSGDLYSFERKYKCANGLKPFSNHLDKLFDNDLLFGPIEKLAKAVGTRCIATESVALAIAVFMRNPYDFRAGILEAVNCGGDSDTIASIAGSLIGFNVGIDGIPLEWRNFNPQFSEALDLGEALCYNKV
jgi:ADP-ribosylglycohydrolase